MAFRGLPRGAGYAETCGVRRQAHEPHCHIFKADAAGRSKNLCDLLVYHYISLWPRVGHEEAAKGWQTSNKINALSHTSLAHISPQLLCIILIQNMIANMIPKYGQP